MTRNVTQCLMHLHQRHLFITEHKAHSAVPHALYQPPPPSSVPVRATLIPRHDCPCFILDMAPRRGMSRPAPLSQHGARSSASSWRRRKFTPCASEPSAPAAAAAAAARCSGPRAVSVPRGPAETGALVPARLTLVDTTKSSWQSVGRVPR